MSDPRESAAAASDRGTPAGAMPTASAARGPAPTVPAPALHLAIDLGAGSGRAIIGGLHGDGVRLQEAHRFTYPPRQHDGHLRWDMARLLAGLADSLGHAQAAADALGAPLVSVGVDAWGVDYGLVDAEGARLEDPICYRDPRTDDVMPEVFARVPREEIFARTGIQFLAFNTLYQLAAHLRDGLPPRAARLLLIPDLCHQALCGAQVTEETNASTTQLIALGTGDWDDALFARLGLPRALMPRIVCAGDALGTLTPALQARAGTGPLRVIAPATHDTGSAVAGTPLAPGWAYISSGTWSLVGVERTAPLVTPDVAEANFTNERGAGGTTRFLTNVMGLWILECCRREWEQADAAFDFGALLARVAAMDDFAGIVFPDDSRFFHPASMTRELRASLRDSGQAAPDDAVSLAKVVLDSLALRYASAIATIERLTGESVSGIHIIGGGARNAYLNQATADAAARPVLAGPMEATAAGNIIVQSMACGDLASLADGRARLLQRGGGLVSRAILPRRTRAWTEAAARYHDIEARALEQRRAVPARGTGSPGA